MDNKDKVTITRHQYKFILVGCMLGTGILSLPRLTVEIIGQDAWFAVVLGMLYPIASVLLIHLLCRRYPDMNFVELSQHITGKFFGKLIILPVIVYCAMAAGIICRIFIEVVSLFLLKETPKVIIILIFLLLVAYLAACDIRIIGRMNELLFYVQLPLFIFAIPAVIAHADFLHLFPLLNHNVGEYMEAAFKTSFAFSGFEMSLILYSYVGKKEKILKAGIASIVITAIIYLYIIVIALLVHGDGLVQKFTFPTIRLLSTTVIPVIERIEFLFIILWIGVAYKPICNQYYFSAHLIEKLFNSKAHKKIVVLMFFVIAAIAIYPDSIDDVFSISDYIGRASLFIGIAIPLVLLIISSLPFVKGVKKYEAK